jgi:putative transposase
MSPAVSLERAVQFIKGGFSYRAKKELGSGLEVWQRGFSDHRIRDEEDYRIHAGYIHGNPVRKGLCQIPAEYPYCSLAPRFEPDDVPQWLKPLILDRL